MFGPVTKPSGKFFVGALTTVGLASLATGVLATSSSAGVYSKTFDVMCTQDNVNDGAPFAVGVTATVTLPDEINVGDEVFPEVSLSLEMPTEVSAEILDQGYAQLEGMVDATAQVTGADGIVTPLVATDFPLAPTVVPDPAAPFTMDTTPAFPSYTPAAAGTLSVALTGDFVTVHDVVVSNDGGGTHSLDPFNCVVAEDVEVVSVEVLDPTDVPTEDPTEDPTDEPTDDPTQAAPTTEAPTVSAPTTVTTPAPTARRLPIVAG